MIMPQLDLILPAYNPSSSWHTYALERIKELQALRPEWQMRLIVVDDASLRGHEPEVQQALSEAMAGAYLHLTYPTNRGKGYAIRYAVERATAPHVLYTDWDFPFCNASYVEALDALLEGAEVVLPVRPTEQYMAHLKPMRRFLSAGSRMINRLLLSLPSSDTQGGIKAFNNEGRRAFLATQVDRFLFDTEFIALATKRGLDIRLTSCHIRPEVQMSRMSWGTFLRELRNIPRLVVARWFS